MRAIQVVIASVAFASASGCSMTTPFGPVGQVPVETSGPSYFGGNGSQLYPSSDEFLAKTREAMDDVGLNKVTERKEGIKTILEARTVNGRKALIEFRPERGNVRVIARFGSFGDEVLSRAFLDRMASRLGTADAEEKGKDVDVSAVLSGRPKPQRTGTPPPGILDRQVADSYRDSVIP